MSYQLPYSLPGIVGDMSGSFWSGQQVEHDLVLHLALSISATIIAAAMGSAPSSVKATVAAPIFSLLKQLEKQSSCSSGFGGKERNPLLRFHLANVSMHVVQACTCPTALASQLGLHQKSCAVPGERLHFRTQRAQENGAGR